MERARLEPRASLCRGLFENGSKSAQQGAECEIQHAAGEEILRRLTPLSRAQEAILQRLGLGTNLYRQLEIQNMES